MLIIYKLFDSYAWNTTKARAFGLSSAVDLSGIWKGEIQSSHDAFTGKTAATLTVKQTGSHISLVLETARSKSESCLAMIFSKATNAVIQYAYKNTPSNSAIGSMHAHEGTAKLVLSTDGQTLTGDYYTGRDREKHGSLTFTRSS
jgi:phosphoribosylformylglycinamidine (FGAM) synthase-like enzyme